MVLEGELVAPRINWTMDDGTGIGIGVEGEAWDALVDGEVCEEARMEIEVDGEVASWGMRRVAIEAGDDPIG